MPSDKRPVLCLLHHTISWKTFQAIHDKLVWKDAGPNPVDLDKVLWQMLRDRQIYCWYAEDHQGDMQLGLQIPEGYDVSIIKNGPRTSAPDSLPTA